MSRPIIIRTHAELKALDPDTIVIVATDQDVSRVRAFLACNILPQHDLPAIAIPDAGDSVRAAKKTLQEWADKSFGGKMSDHAIIRDVAQLEKLDPLTVLVLSNGYVACAGTPMSSLPGSLPAVVIVEGCVIEQVRPEFIKEMEWA